jgi:hypothetical protein
LHEINPDLDKTEDLENRVIEVLEKTISFFLPEANMGRIPTPDELIKIVRENFFRTSSPWKLPFKLERFGDSYNAAALETWYVPLLLVDPDDQWIKQISASGPLLITGMRGCGKTMLLRALDFHARAAQKDDEKSAIIERLKKDNYVGFFVSCINLLSIPGSTEISKPMERLFCAYCLEIIRAARHLQELDRDIVVPRYHDFIGEVLKRNLGIPDEKEWLTDNDLERFLLNLNTSLKNPDFNCRMKNPPAESFIQLGQAVRRCSSIWSASRVFFLLDDVSTRYLQKELIENILSNLLFQNPVGAFKITTEAQTLGMALLSPGLIEKGRQGRDFDVFDLGGDVYEKTKIKGTKKEKLFIEEILERRIKYCPNHPLDLSPRRLLGDCALEEIARRITKTSANSKERKAVYHGISALSAVCVGDIGDVISIYEQMHGKSAGKHYPISPPIQSECFQNFCSRRLYDLNRRENALKDFALTFAEASYKLLIKSSRNNTQSKRKGLRQYTSLYVRITAGDTEKQFRKLRELIDAGVFVFHGGTPRTKVRDADPIHQFKLTYRKLFGLSNFIGLAERDRFELSGKDLEEWLESPEKGKDILLRNLGGDTQDTNQDEYYENKENERGETLMKKRTDSTVTQTLLASTPVLGEVSKKGEEISTIQATPIGRLFIDNIEGAKLGSLDIELIVI